MSNCEISESDMKLIREFVDVFWATINANEDIVSSEARVFVAWRLYERREIITSSPIRYVRSASCRFYERRENIAAYQRQPFLESGEFDVDPTPVIFIDCEPEANWAHKCVYTLQLGNDIRCGANPCWRSTIASTNGRRTAI